MSSRFDQFQAWNVELAALDQLKKIFYFKTIQNILMTCWLSVERSLPFGLLAMHTVSIIILSVNVFSSPWEYYRHKVGNSVAHFN